MLVLITEKQLRKIIKKELLKEGFLTSKVENLNAIKINNYVLRALGYSYLDKTGIEEFEKGAISKSVKFLTGDDDRQDYVIVHVPKEIVSDLELKGFKKVKGDYPNEYVKSHGNKPRGYPSVKISNAGKSSYFNAEKLNANKFQLMAIKTSTPGIKFSSDDVATGAPTGADYTIEIAGIIGGIPGLGEPVDIAAALLAIIKDPPDYIIAAFSMLCAAPVFGTAFAFARPAARKIASEGGAQGAKKLGKYLKEKTRIDAEKVETVRKSTNSAFEKVKKSKAVDVLASSSGKSKEEVVERLDETQRVFDSIVEGMEDAGQKKGGRAVSKEVKEEFKKQLKPELDKILKSMRSGSLNNLVKEHAKEIRDQIYGNADEISLAYDEALTELLKNRPDLRGDTSRIVFNTSIEFLQKYSEPLINKKIAIPNPPGGEIVFENFESLRQHLSELCRLHDVSFSDLLNGAVAQSISGQSGYRLVSDANLERIASDTIKKLSEVNLKIVDDLDLAKKSVAEGGFELIDSSGVTYGYMTQLGEEVLINISAFTSKAPDIPFEKPIEQMKGTIQEEFIHSADALIASVVIVGDDMINQFYRFGGKLAFRSSEVLAKRVFDPGKNSLAVTRKALERTFDIARNDAKFMNISGGEIFDKLLTTDKGVAYDAVSGNFNIDAVDQLPQKLQSEFNISEFHSQILAMKLLRERPYADRLYNSSDQFLKAVRYDMSYHGNPMEFFAKCQNIKEVMIEQGFDNPKDTEQILEFFQQYSEFDELVLDVPKLRGNQLFANLHANLTLNVYPANTILKSLSEFL